MKPKSIRGHFLGADGDMPVAVKLEIENDGDSSRVGIGSMAGPTSSDVSSRDARVSGYIHRVQEAIRVEAKRNEPPRAVPKPPKRKRRQPEPVICPDCLGYRSFDCETCEGAGVVPG